MGLGRTHKRKVKMVSTCTTNKRRRLVQVKWKWCGKLNRDNLKHKLHTRLQPLGGGITPLPIIYFVPLRRDYIQMSLFLETLKWEFPNQDSYCPKTLDAHIFFKSSLF